MNNTIAPQYINKKLNPFSVIKNALKDININPNKLIPKLLLIFLSMIPFLLFDIF